MGEEQDFRVADNPGAGRYELFVANELAGFADYRLGPGRILLPYIEVDPALQGRGLASRFTAEILADCRARGLTVEATCPFIVDYLRSHPEYDDLTAPRA
jgi:predicted GNAT family acetyltransferase